MFHEHLMRRRRLAARDEEQPAAPAADAAVAEAAAPLAKASTEDSMNELAVQPTRGTDDGCDPGLVQERVIEKLRGVFDPEIPVNIYELGLVYDIRADEEGRVQIKMTLTSPHCPVAESLPAEVERAATSAEGVRDAEVEIVWDPAWSPDMMSEAAKLELGMF